MSRGRLFFCATFSGLSLLHPTPRQKNPNSSLEKKKSSRRAEIKVRKNEMKLRKKEIKVPKNFFVLRWRISVFYRGIFHFLNTTP